MWRTVSINMKMIINITVLGIMIRLSISDIRDRHISKAGLSVWAVLVVIYQTVCLYQGSIYLEEIGMGIGLGFVFLFISWITDEAVGYGDSVAIMILGGLLGFWSIAENLAWAFLINGMWAIGLITVQRVRRKKMTKEMKMIPFLPFLTMGYVFVLIGQGGAL